MIAKALQTLDGAGDAILAASRIVQTPPLGHSRRRFANACALLAGKRPPPAMLARLQDMERDFGRQRLGRPWGERVLDLDIVLWSGGTWARDDLVIPHPLFRLRNFVLAPAAEVAPGWRDPLTGLTIRQLSARLTRSRRALR